MKIVHIIPAAFNYFDSIRTLAFQSVQLLQEDGWEVDAFTLQYGQEAPTRSFQKTVLAEAPLRQYSGTVKAPQLRDALDQDYDIVHLHVPFLGMGPDLLRWRSTHPQGLLVVTRYSAVPIKDLFAIFVRLYNAYYIPRIIAQADTIFVYVKDASPKSLALQYEMTYNGI